MIAIWALVLYALALWGATPGEHEGISVVEGGDPAAPAWTSFAPGRCEIAVTTSFPGLSEALRRAVIVHEVGHCVTGGLYHPYCLCSLQNPAFYGEAVDRAYTAPWREYPYRWYRIALPGVAFEGAN